MRRTTYSNSLSDFEKNLLQRHKISKATKNDEQPNNKLPPLTVSVPLAKNLYGTTAADEDVLISPVCLEILDKSKLPIPRKKSANVRSQSLIKSVTTDKLHRTMGTFSGAELKRQSDATPARVVQMSKSSTSKALLR